MWSCENHHLFGRIFVGSFRGPCHPSHHRASRECMFYSTVSHGGSDGSAGGFGGSNDVLQRCFNSHIYLEPRHELCFDRKLDHILGGGWSKIEVTTHDQVLGIYIYIEFQYTISLWLSSSAPARLLQGNRFMATPDPHGKCTIHPSTSTVHRPPSPPSIPSIVVNHATSLRQSGCVPPGLPWWRRSSGHHRGEDPQRYVSLEPTMANQAEGEHHDIAKYQHI